MNYLLCVYVLPHRFPAVLGKCQYQFSSAVLCFAFLMSVSLASYSHPLFAPFLIGSDHSAQLIILQEDSHHVKASRSWALLWGGIFFPLSTSQSLLCLEIWFMWGGHNFKSWWLPHRKHRWIKWAMLLDTHKTGPSGLSVLPLPHLVDTWVIRNIFLL